jgi:hypothetical protein
MLNDASEKFIANRLSNYVKSDVLNSEKMTPHFLKIAEKNVESNPSSIRRPDNSPFLSCAERGEHIVNFTKTYIKIPLMCLKTLITALKHS